MPEADPTTRHLRALTRLTGPNGPIAIDAATASHRQPRNVTPDGEYRAARRVVHRRILQDYFAQQPDVERGRQAIVTAGPPGAGKSSALTTLIPANERHRWREIDPDTFKSLLLAHERTAGTYDQLVPEPVQRLGDSQGRFAPGELAALVHEESSLLASQARQLALQRGENVIIDGVHASPEKIRDRLRSLEEAGYASVQLLAVDASRAVSRARVEHRWRIGYRKFLADLDGDAQYEARYVPESVTDEVYASPDDPVSACTRATAAAMNSAEARRLGVRASLYIVNEPAGTPRLATTYQADTTTGRLHIARAPRTPRTDQPQRAHGGGTHDTSSDDPSGAEGSSDTWVDTYTRADGTIVQGHRRRRGSG